MALPSTPSSAPATTAAPALPTTATVAPAPASKPTPSSPAADDADDKDTPVPLPANHLLVRAAHQKFVVDLASRFETASSVIYRGHTLPAREPVLVKLSLASLADVAASLPADDPAKALFDAAVAAAVPPRPASPFAGGSPPPHGAAPGNGDDEPDNGCQHEARVHTALYDYHASHATMDKLATVVLARATLADGHALVLPLHRPLQPDTRIPKLPLLELVNMAHDVTSGLAAVHDAGFVHGDVSVSNLVVHCTACAAGDCEDSASCAHVRSKPDAADAPRDRRYCLIDFGLCQRLEDTSTTPLCCGTPGFVAPEIVALQQLEAQRSDGLREDVVARWSLPSPALRPHTLGIPVPSIPGAGAAGYSYASSTGSGYDSECGASSLASSPDSDRSGYLSSTGDSGWSSPNPAAAANPHRALRRRLGAARDLYSFGVIFGLLLSPYLPLCDADHLGSPRTTPDYIRAHITPRLRALRAVLADELYGRARILEDAIDVLLKCLAHAPRARPTARKLLRHRLFRSAAPAKTVTDEDGAVALFPVELLADLESHDAWQGSAWFGRVRMAMEDRRNEWECMSSWELEAADAAAEAAEDRDEGGVPAIHVVSFAMCCESSA
ncbi:hypothetical protein H9P43_001277 [Blastocladiella emersonii ATCC 22665]|nr:hypothetical protein H9P43_001277 [Blastocladiella emersonii ATCC 22665]